MDKPERPTGPRLKQVLLVEDHASFRQSLAHLLDQDPAFGDLTIVQAGSLAEARAGISIRRVLVYGLS